MKARWGVHPVLEGALQVLDEDAVPEALERALPAHGRLSTRALVQLCHRSLEHLSPVVSARQRADFERLRELVARYLASPEREPARQPWHTELFDARTDEEHGRGAVKVAALAAQVAWGSVMRAAPGAAAHAAKMAAEVTERTARILSKEPQRLHAFLLALCAELAALQSSGDD